MVHLSEALNLPVFDAGGARLGRVDDLLADSSHGIVDRIVLRGGRGRSFVRWEGVDEFSPETRRVVLADGAAVEVLDAAARDRLHLKRDVLDRQIIDIQGRKVVKVNDILLEPSAGRLALKRVEIGLRGAVRRLLAGLVRPMVVRRIADGLAERSIPWDYVGLVDPGAAGIRLKVHQQLARMHPADLADILEDLGRVERRDIVSALDPETAAQALSEAEPSVQAALVEAIHVERAADLLEEMQPDEAADILGDLPEARSRALLDAMEEEEAEDVRELLRFRDDTAGGLMTTDFFKARSEWSAGQTLAELRQVDADLLGELDEIPVVGPDDHLVGVVPLVRLVRAPEDRPVTEVMRREARAVTPTTPFRDILERFDKYHLRGLAVVNEYGELAGLIAIEDVLGRVVEKG
jgi:flagellar motility protein MotE (MotC chaperone)/sporulation protein YlmC with PRC-barrel domain